MALYKKGLKERVKVSDKSEIIKIDIFWLGILVGFVGGLLGNIWVAYMFRWIDNITDLISLIGASISTLLILCFTYTIWKKTIRKHLE
jgi:fructose-specific phosphotransferase system IIC component